MAGNFPLFLNLENRKVLIVGGGKIAYDKLEKLLIFTENITIIATEIIAQIVNQSSKYDIKIHQKSYERGDIKGFDIVIVATDNLQLQKEIWQESRGKGIFVNSVDLPEYCDFFFGSFIKEGDLTIAISTSGSSPAISKYLKIYLKKLLPKNLTEFLKEMKSLRETLPKGKERMQILELKAKEFFNVYHHTNK